MQVTLAVNGVTVATQTVDLQPGQAREVRFPPYQFDVAVQPGRALFVPAEVSIPADNLPADDKRFLAVPVVSSLPVVFVDSVGPDENPQRNRFGETFRLRRLLAPVTARGQSDPQLIQVRHVKIDRVDRDLLKDARLVVIAGVSKPEGADPRAARVCRAGGQPYDCRRRRFRSRGVDRRRMGRRPRRFARSPSSRTRWADCPGRRAAGCAPSNSIFPRSTMLTTRSNRLPETSWKSCTACPSSSRPSRRIVSDDVVSRPAQERRETDRQAACDARRTRKNGSPRWPRRSPRGRRARPTAGNSHNCNRLGTKCNRTGSCGRARRMASRTTRSLPRTWRSERAPRSSADTPTRFPSLSSGTSAGGACSFFPRASFATGTP